LANAGGTYSILPLRNYPAGWNIVGMKDANGDGRSDIFWHNPTTGALEYWLMNGATITYGGARAVPNIYRVATLGDFNGDGLADIVWYNTAKTELWLWQGISTGAGFSIVKLNFPGYPTGWDIVGSGDANGDGRDDIFWHNATAGALEYWLMNGPAITYGGARSVPNQYRVASVGDFTGDGRADLVWRNEARTELWMWQGSASGAFSIVPLPFPGGYPAGWEIIPATRPTN
jgi:uncharacterized protein YbdZ (MbtH family)